MCNRNDQKVEYLIGKSGIFDGGTGEQLWWNSGTSDGGTVE